MSSLWKKKKIDFNGKIRREKNTIFSLAIKKSKCAVDRAMGNLTKIWMTLEREKLSICRIPWEMVETCTRYYAWMQVTTTTVANWHSLLNVFGIFILFVHCVFLVSFCFFKIVHSFVVFMFHIKQKHFFFVTIHANYLCNRSRKQSLSLWSPNVFRRFD